MASTYGRPNHSAEAHGSFHFGRTLRADAVRLVRIRRLHHFSALLPHRLVGRCGARSSGRVFRSRARTVDGVPVGTREGRASGNTKRNENGDSENGVHDGLPHTRFPSGPVQTGISRHPAWRRLKSRLAATDCRVWGAIRFASVLLRGRWAQVLQRAEKPSGKPVRRKAQEEERARAQLRRAACQDQERGRWHPPNGAHRRWSAQSAGCASSMSWQFTTETTIVEGFAMVPASGGQTYPAIARREKSTIAINRSESSWARGFW